ncbi:VWA domain-containing protein [Alloacidobacterium dinghuense]|uniref:VWA domain-containing protein n=1 Tax=Alloacidobacterium dinghuense TaxID=2763107 RepID=A0A7G8BM65_9BACT|nr:VWA domain-containing protein [Alloacidobacterium dinghuense]QNI33635.1 VWA domain-containing protein [Alloacidobacterium dinghuense]
MRFLPVSLFALLLPATLQAQTSPPIRVDVKLVNVFVNVTDANGTPVGGLIKDDFTLAEDGRPQKIAVFERQSEMPLSIVLAIDTSGSVNKDLAIEKHAAHAFVHSLLRPVDRLDLIDFSSDVREVVAFTNKLKPIDYGIDNLMTGPATALYSAVYLASQSLATQPGRKVLILISDGGNTVKGTDYADALEQAVRSETMVFSIIDVPIEADAGRDTGGEHAMITLSQDTGGKYYYADAAHLDAAFQKVSEDLRTQYLLAYYPEHRITDSDYRKIDVSLKQPPNAHYSVRHRTGYYATPGH